MARRGNTIVLGALPFVGLVVVWQLLLVAGWAPAWLVSTPLEVGETLIRSMADATLFRLIGISMLNALPAFFAAVVIALLLGAVVGANPTARRLLFPSIAALYVVPSLAWLPMIVLLFGFTRTSVWILIFLSSFTKMIYSVIGGVRSVRPEWVLAAKNFGYSKTETVFRVLLPAALPQILSGLRQGFGASWRSLIGAEMLVPTVGGLGSYIWYAQWYLAMDRAFVGLIAIAGIGILVEYVVFHMFEQRTVVRWGMVQDDGA